MKNSLLQPLSFGVRFTGVFPHILFMIMSMVSYSALAGERHADDPTRQGLKEKIKDNVKQNIHNLKVMTGNNPYKKERPETPALSPEDSRKRKEDFLKENHDKWQKNRGR